MERILSSEQFQRPLSWEAMRSLLLQSRGKGIIPSNLPGSFTCSDVLCSTFDDMLPAKSSLQDILDKVGHHTYDHNRDEVGRAIVTTANWDKMQVQTKDQGKTRNTLYGQNLRMPGYPNQFGLIHSHPEDDGPSSTDISSLLTGNNVVSIIITPKRVHTLVRTSGAQQFALQAIAKGYVYEYGKRHGNNQEDTFLYIKGIFSGLSREDIHQQLGVWLVNDQALSDLYVARYEMPRGGSVFRRKI